MLKKLVVGLALSSISLTCFADISFNESQCAALANGNLTSCFQNKTNGYLTDYQLKETYIYETGNTMETISNIGAMQPGFFTVISTSSADFSKNKIVAASYSIIKGNAEQYQVIPGCSTEFTDKTISKSLLSIHKVNGVLHCE